MDAFRSLFEQIDVATLRREVERLEWSHPRREPREQARRLARRAALRCAATGAVTALPSGAFALATLGADLAYLVHQQFRLVLAIAAVYGHQANARERFTEALVCLALGSGLGIGKHGMAAVMDSARAEGGFLAERIGSRLRSRRLERMMPFVGAVSGGALNYLAVRTVGRSAIRYYESKIDPLLADQIWAEGDREHA